MGIKQSLVEIMEKKACPNLVTLIVQISEVYEHHTPIQTNRGNQIETSKQIAPRWDYHRSRQTGLHVT